VAWSRDSRRTGLEWKGSGSSRGWIIWRLTVGRPVTFQRHAACKDRNTSSSLLQVATAVATRSSVVRAWKSGLLQPYVSFVPSISFHSNSSLAHLRILPPRYVNNLTLELGKPALPRSLPSKQHISKQSAVSKKPQTLRHVLQALQGRIRVRWSAQARALRSLWNSLTRL
jgi:hypothetical protein